MPITLWEPARGQRVPVVVWARDANEATLRQLAELASRPFVAERVCAMADAHVASGVAVGTVFATEHAVVPRALGGDLGCGVAASRLAIDAHELDCDRVVADLVRAVPAGDRVHGRVEVPDALLAPPLSTSALERTRAALARRHLGTLGGGNHFLELDRDADGGVWLLVHSGSRGLGGAVAEHHARAAEARDPDPLAALDVREDAGRSYLADHAWSLAFARANRDAIAARALEVIAHVLGRDVDVLEHIDVHHNHVGFEVHDTRTFLVHRKGAIHVPHGSSAVVPGSMATSSYVVEGLGSPLAFDSCSHGAGRELTRTEARRRVTAASLERAMRRIAWPSHLAHRLVEEAPAAYRDLGEVLDAQRDLVRRVRRLEPIAVVKG